MLSQKRIRALSYALALVLAGVLGGMFCLTQDAVSAPSALSPAEQRLLAAETEPNKEKAIELLKPFLTQTEIVENASKPAFTPEHIKSEIVENYLSLYFKEHDIDHLQKARAFIKAQYLTAAERAWAYAYIVSKLSVDGKEFQTAGVKTFVLNMIDDVDAEAAEVADADVQSKIYYALALTITRVVDNKPVFDDALLKRVHNMALGMQLQSQRRETMKRLALVAKDMPDTYPEAYAPLYALLAEKEVTDQAFIDLQDKALSEDRFDLAVTSLQMIEDKKLRTEKMFSLFETSFEQNDISRARRVVERIDDPAKSVDGWSALAGYYLVGGFDKEGADAYAKAQSIADKIIREDSREKAQKLISDRKASAQKKAEKKSQKVNEADAKLREQALVAFEKDGIASAVAITRQINDAIYRVKTFRILAEAQTKLNDSYGLLNKAKGDKPVTHYFVKDSSGELRVPAKDVVAKFEGDVARQANKDPAAMTLDQGIPSSIGEVLTHEPLVERLNVNGEMLRAAIPLPGEAKITRAYYENSLYNSKFYEVFGNAGFVDKQGVSAPDVIVIEKGIVDLPQLYDALKNQGLDNYLTRDGKTYTLNRPLVVGPGTSFIVSGDEAESLRMSTQSGAYLVVMGDIHILDTKLIAWNDAKNEPMWAKYEEKRNFRPYIVAWSQGAMYIGNSELIAIGYGNGKSYGLAFSSGPNIWVKYGNDNQTRRPTGIVTNNSFRNNLYGFYSYEADDVVLSGNEYVDNIVYGVDPHDRSRRLAIGYNTAYDTHKKHGIIISREVDDSIIFGNLTFDNKGTGIMLDRDSNGTLVYGNTSFHNKQDGMTIFESDCEIIAANRIFANNASGMRIRNSYNLGVFYNDLAHNKAAAVIAYEGNLKEEAAQQHRDFALDPYDEFTGVSVVGNRIDGNGVGLNVDTVAGLFLKNNAFVNQSPKLASGKTFKDNPEMLFRYDQKKYGVSVNATCPELKDQLYVQACKYRHDGTLTGDGMDLLPERVKTSACAKGTTDIKVPYHEEEEDE